MTFTVKDWRNATTYAGGGDESTPLSAEALEDLETRVTDYTDSAMSNVVAYGATGDGTTDDSSAFSSAISAAGDGGVIFVPAGDYRVGDVSLLTHQTLRGVGRDSKLRAKAGATYTLKMDGLYNVRLADLCIDGNSQASKGLRIRGLNTAAGSTSQSHLLDHVAVEFCSTGITVDGAGASDQVDKNTYLQCWISNCDIGFESNSSNSQNQCFLGGAINDCDTVAVRTTGTMSFVGMQFQQTTMDTGKMMEFTGGVADSIVMVDCINENHSVGFDPGSSAWPLLGVRVTNCVIHAVGDIAQVDRGGTPVVFAAEQTRFLGGAIELLGNDSAFREVDCDLSGCDGVVHTGTNTKHYTSPLEWHEIGAAGEPAFQNGYDNFGSGQANAAYAMDSDGVVHLKGFIDNAATPPTPGTAFTLPSGYRPAEPQSIATTSNGAFGELSVATNGNVSPSVGHAFWFSLANMTFKGA